ncbi:MAG: hypothetical protein C0605_07255 [Hyphomicrobiales bacterium]|nr:MAG: hypothetical protein C0605_07255 [Hyphomicrobiales bacterium]
MTKQDPPAQDAPTQEAPANAHEIDPRLLELLVCPVTHQTLEYDRKAGELISRAAGLAYPIRNGIPIMLADEARKLD